MTFLTQCKPKYSGAYSEYHVLGDARHLVIANKRHQVGEW